MPQFGTLYNYKQPNAPQFLPFRMSTIILTSPPKGTAASSSSSGRASLNDFLSSLLSLYSSSSSSSSSSLPPDDGASCAGGAFTVSNKYFDADITCRIIKWSDVAKLSERNFNNVSENPQDKVDGFIVVLDGSNHDVGRDFFATLQGVYDLQLEMSMVVELPRSSSSVASSSASILSKPSLSSLPMEYCWCNSPTPTQSSMTLNSEGFMEGWGRLKECIDMCMWSSRVEKREKRNEAMLHHQPSITTSRSTNTNDTEKADVCGISGTDNDDNDDNNDNDDNDECANRPAQNGVNLAPAHPPPSLTSTESKGSQHQADSSGSNTEEDAIVSSLSPDQPAPSYKDDCQGEGSLEELERLMESITQIRQDAMSGKFSSDEERRAKASDAAEKLMQLLDATDDAML